MLVRFTQMACPALRVERGKLPAATGVACEESAGRRIAPCSSAKDSGWEPDGVTLQVRFCEEPGTNRRMAEIMWHRRETRRQTENTNISLTDGEDPAYSPCGLARPRELAGGNPAWVIVRREPSIEPCGVDGNGHVDA